MHCSKGKHSHHTIHHKAMPPLTTPLGNEPGMGAAPRSDIIHHTYTHIQQPRHRLGENTLGKQDSNKADTHHKATDGNHKR